MKTIQTHADFENLKNELIAAAKRGIEYHRNKVSTLTSVMKETKEKLDSMTPEQRNIDNVEYVELQKKFFVTQNTLELHNTTYENWVADYKKKYNNLHTWFRNIGAKKSNKHVIANRPELNATYSDANCIDHNDDALYVIQLDNEDFFDYCISNGVTEA